MKLICSVLGERFMYEPETRKYITTIRQDGSGGEVSSRVPEKIWNEYKNGLSVMLMQAAEAPGGTAITAEPASLGWIRCTWNENESWATDSLTGREVDYMKKALGPVDACGRFFRTLCAQIDRRLEEYRKRSES